MPAQMPELVGRDGKKIVVAVVDGPLALDSDSLDVVAIGGDPEERPPLGVFPRGVADGAVVVRHDPLDSQSSLGCSG